MAQITEIPELRPLVFIIKRNERFLRYKVPLETICCIARPDLNTYALPFAPYPVPDDPYSYRGNLIKAKSRFNS